MSQHISDIEAFFGAVERQNKNRDIIELKRFLANPHPWIPAEVVAAERKRLAQLESES